MRHTAPLVLLALLSACATTPTLTLSPAAELRDAHDLANDGAPGDVWLHWRYQARVESSARSPAPPSVVRLVAAVTRFTPSEAPVHATLCVPAEAGPPRLSTQRLTPTSAPTVAPATARPLGGGACLDPGQVAWRFELPAPLPSEILEFSAVFEVPGLLAVDLQPLVAPSGPSSGSAPGSSGRLVEGLWRYDLPEHATARLAVRGRDETAVTTPQADRVAHGLFLRDLRARPEGDAQPPHLVFATTSVAPMGARSDLATSWEAVAAPYRAGLEALSPGLSENHGPPVALAATTAEARVAEAFAWVRDRPTRLARPEAAWSAGRSLPGPLRSNDLTDTDRVHTLAWLLRAHGVPFRFAVARPAAAAPLDPAAPQPRAFQTALLAVRQGAGLSSGSAPGSSGLSSGSAPGSSGLSSGSAPGSSGDAERWQLLDPGCATCSPGELRPALRGGAALLLLANQPAQLLSLSAGDPVSLPSHTPEATP